MASRDDRLWLQNVQRKLYERSREKPDYVFEKLWALVTDPRNLRIALARVHRNRGARTAGIDRVTVRRVLLDGAETFLDEVRKDRRGRTFRPKPARRVLIPKAGKPGKTPLLVRRKDVVLRGDQTAQMVDETFGQGPKGTAPAGCVLILGTVGIFDGINNIAVGFK